MTLPDTSFAYLDASAFVKLVVREAESEPLARALGDWPLRASSSVLSVEGIRACARVSEAAERRARQMIPDVTLIPPDLPLLEDAARIRPVTLRSLDAIHLATALSLGDQLGVFMAYDERLVEAAGASSLMVARPS